MALRSRSLFFSPFSRSLSYTTTPRFPLLTEFFGLNDIQRKKAFYKQSERVKPTKQYQRDNPVDVMTALVMQDKWGVLDADIQRDPRKYNINALDLRHDEHGVAHRVLLSKELDERQKIDKLKKLAKRGADFNLRCDCPGNRSLLDYTIGQGGSKRIIGTLLDLGADPSLRNNMGDNALHVAQLVGRHDELEDLFGKCLDWDAMSQMQRQENNDKQKPIEVESILRKVIIAQEPKQDFKKTSALSLDEKRNKFLEELQEKEESEIISGSDTAVATIGAPEPPRLTSAAKLIRSLQLKPR